MATAWAAADGHVGLVPLGPASGPPRKLDGHTALLRVIRFSPDGTRLAFVSTAYEGRFHVFLLALGEGETAGPVRLTEDHDSGLPRYYYSRVDHEINPAWTPDGKSLIVADLKGQIEMWELDGLKRGRKFDAGVLFKYDRLQDVGGVHFHDAAETVARVDAFAGGNRDVHVLGYFLQRLHV